MSEPIEVRSDPSAPLRPLGRLDVVELMGRIQFYVGEDRITTHDDEVMTACSVIAAYAMEHMVDEDFLPESPMWREFS